MKEVKEFFEINESINKIFDDQVLEKMVMKKGDDFLGKVLKDKGDDFLGKVLKDKGDDFLRQLLLKEGPDYIVNFLFNIINENEEIKRKFQEKSKE